MDYVDPHYSLLFSMNYLKVVSSTKLYKLKATTLPTGIFSSITFYFLLNAINTSLYSKSLMQIHFTPVVEKNPF